MNKSQKGYNGNQQSKSRRVGVINLLNEQLKRNTKRKKNETLPLEEKDVVRINKELNILKQRS